MNQSIRIKCQKCLEMRSKKMEDLFKGKEHVSEKCIKNSKCITDNISTNEILEKDNKKSTLTEKDCKEFLLLLYFGKNKDYLENCLDRAYRDFNRTLHGFYKHKHKEIILIEAKKYLKEELIKIRYSEKVILQEDFDRWHKSVCYGLKNIFSKYEYLDFYVGQAQKWINMSLKYIFLHDETRLNGFNSIYEYCHIPIDNIILSKIDYNFSTAWSRINDYDIYLDFQKYIRKIVLEESPLDFEFRLFIK